MAARTVSNGCTLPLKCTYAATAAPAESTVQAVGASAEFHLEPVPDGALDLTCAHAAIELAGPLAGECLARFCAIDVRPAVLPVGGFRPGSVARTPGYVLRTGQDSLLLLTGWAYGEYLWETVATAAQRLGGGPIGEDALRA